MIVFFQPFFDRYGTCRRRHTKSIVSASVTISSIYQRFSVGNRKPLVDGGNGHGCGHNTFGVAASAGAVAIKKWLEENNHSGTIKVFGTPAEEGGGGKVYMVREGLFDDVDIVLDWHPGARNAVNVGTGTAIQMVDYTFHGIAAHAAGNPDKGR